MGTQKSIKLNMVMNIILTASNFFFPLITYAYVARILTPNGTGKVAFVQSVLAYFSYFAALGISGYGTRECAKVRDDKEELSTLVNELFRINCISTVFAYLLLAVSLLTVPKFQEYTTLFIIMSAAILLQTLGMEWLYSSLEKYTYIAVRSICFKAISVALIFLFVKDQGDYVAYGAITLISTSASYLLNFLNARKYISYKKIKTWNLKKHIKPIMVFFFTSIIITLYCNFDSIMLGFLKDNREVGIYNSALKIKSLILSVSTAITSVLIPRMSIYYEGGKIERYNELALKSMRVTLVLMLPIAVFTFINAADVIVFVCGSEYLSAVPTLRIFMVCALVLSLTNLFGNQMLIPKGDEKRYSISVFIGMFINLGLNFILIPKLASVGAAIATLATESFNAICMGMGCRKEIRYLVKNIRKNMYFVALLMAAILEMVLNGFCTQWPILVRLVWNASVLLGTYYGLLLLRKEPVLCLTLRTLQDKVLRNIKHH